MGKQPTWKTEKDLYVLQYLYLEPGVVPLASHSHYQDFYISRYF